MPTMYLLPKLSHQWNSNSRSEYKLGLHMNHQLSNKLINQIVIKANKATVLTVRKHLHCNVRDNLVGTPNRLICVGIASVLAAAKGKKLMPMQTLVSLWHRYFLSTSWHQSQPMSPSLHTCCCTQEEKSTFQTQAIQRKLLIMHPYKMCTWIITYSQRVNGNVQSSWTILPGRHAYLWTGRIMPNSHATP